MVKFNAGNIGFYRTHYAYAIPAILSAVRSGSLPVDDRLGILVCVVAVVVVVCVCVCVAWCVCVFSCCCLVCCVCLFKWLFH